MSPKTANFIRAILQGMTGAGLYCRLRYPGQADVFMGTETADEVRSGEFYRSLLAMKRKHASETDMVAYYERLYRTEPHDHIHRGACTTY